MNRAQYDEAFTEAMRKSLKWKAVDPRDLLVLQDGGSAAEALPVVENTLNAFQRNFDYSVDLIRINCAGVHLDIAKALYQARVPFVITIGDVMVNGKPEYGTSYQYLKQELRGAHIDRGIYNYHVWLTFADMHVIDATFAVYKLAAHHGGPGIPEDFRWADYVYISDRATPGGLDLAHKPMLTGHRLLSQIF